MKQTPLKRRTPLSRRIPLRDHKRERIGDDIGRTPNGFFPAWWPKDRASEQAWRVKRNKKKITSAERRQIVRFRKAAAKEFCAVCGAHTVIGTTIVMSMHAHHVIYKQHLSEEHRWDPRNAMPVCYDCHERHHSASRRISLSALTESNLEFAREVLGEAADDYLKRRYRDD